VDCAVQETEVLDAFVRHGLAGCNKNLCEWQINNLMKKGGLRILKNERVKWDYSLFDAV